MSIELPPLPYAYDALAPVISQETMEFHHDKHHAAYVTNLNNAIKETEVADWSAESLVTNLAAVPDAIRGAVRNNAGGHVNHSLFWDLLTPGGASAPTGELADASSSRPNRRATHDRQGEIVPVRHGSPATRRDRHPGPIAD